MGLFKHFRNLYLSELAQLPGGMSFQETTRVRDFFDETELSIGVVEGGVLYFVRTGHIGRPAFATDGTGAKVWEVSYLPFGQVQVSTGTPIALRFPGQWFQAESGLYQNWMRDYDPTTGRYLQADPLGLVDGPSVYGYALQNPGRYVDPRGEATYVVCRPLEGVLGEMSSARHCRIIVVRKKCTCSGDTQFFLGGGDRVFNGLSSSSKGVFVTDRLAYEMNRPGFTGE